MINKKEKYSLLKPNFFDMLLGVVILFLSIGSLIWMKNGKVKSNHVKAVIYQENKILHEIPLSAERDIELDQMDLQVKDGRIRVSYSDCPHKICSHTGFVSIPGQTIVCVPNKVLIEIVGQKSSTKYHAVSY